jgi:hypothetical protein
MMAQEWRRPAAMATTPESSKTVVGFELLAVPPLPLCPYSLSPQHFTEPSTINAQEWALPAAIAVASDTPSTKEGVSV